MLFLVPTGGPLTTEELDRVLRRIISTAVIKVSAHNIAPGFLLRLVTEHGAGGVVLYHGFPDAVEPILQKYPQLTILYLSLQHGRPSSYTRCSWDGRRAIYATHVLLPE